MLVFLSAIVLGFQCLAFGFRVFPRFNNVLAVRGTSTSSLQDPPIQSEEPEQRYLSVFNTGALNITATNPFGAPAASVKEARDEILSMVESSEPLSEFERFRLDYLVKYLEATHVPIHTGPFLSLAIGGSWICKYTNALLPRADPTLSTVVTQNILPAPNHSHGILTNRVAWNVERPDDTGSGVLEIRCKYTVNSKAGLVVSLDEHVLSIDKLPLDPEEIVMTMQRTIPFEFFDPDGAVLRTTFVDPSIRIARISGPIFVGLFEVHVRTEPTI